MNRKAGILFGLTFLLIPLLAYYFIFGTITFKAFLMALLGGSLVGLAYRLRFMKAVNWKNNQPISRDQIIIFTFIVIVFFVLLFLVSPWGQKAINKLIP